MTINRDTLRQATLGAKKHFRKEIVEFNGQEFEIRQPTIKSRSELRAKCTTVTKDGVSFDTFEFLVWSVIQNTYVPNTDERVFDDTDYNVLVENPTGGFMDKFSEIASKLLNVDTETKKKFSKKTTKIS